MKNQYFSFVKILVLLLRVTAAARGGSPPNLEEGKVECAAPGQTQEIWTVDGEHFLGRIVAVTGDSVKVETRHGTMILAQTELRKIVLQEPEVTEPAREPAYRNVNFTRLFFSPTGRLLPRGHGYFADYLLFFPMVSYGVTDFLTLGGGVSLFPSSDQIVYFTPKLEVYAQENAAVAAGLLLVELPGGDNEGIAYGVGTFSGPGASFTIGGGYGYVNGKPAQKPMVVLGFHLLSENTFSFISENWIFPEIPNPLVSLGVRFSGQRLSADLALCRFLQSGEYFFPFVDFVYTF